MARCICAAHPNILLHVGPGNQPVQFVDGFYETNDEMILSALGACKYPVITVERPEPKIQESEELENGSCTSDTEHS